MRKSRIKATRGNKGKHAVQSGQPEQCKEKYFVMKASGVEMKSRNKN